MAARSPRGGRIEFAGHLAGGFADIEQRAAAFLHEDGGALVEALGEFVDRPYLLIEFAVLALAEVRQQAIDFGDGSVEARECGIGLAQDLVDLVALACQRRGVGLETQ